MTPSIFAVPPSFTIESLKHIILQQYRLYDIHHHDAGVRRSDHRISVEPKAHTLMDIYKCLHQGEFGIAHEISPYYGNKIAVEIYRAEPMDTEPILENISLDGSISRINLRPYRKHYKGEETKAIDLLTAVCHASARIKKGCAERFLEKLSVFGALNNKNELTADNVCFVFPPRQVEQFLAEVKKEIETSHTAPAVSHSPLYRRLNAPTYRVVDTVAIERSPLSHILQHDR